jgi:tripartite-type tricarboxylate transporter receptor subunit TctC
MKKLSLIFAACMLICAFAAPAARAEWPDRPIRFIVGFGPGGANDLIARFAAEGVGKQLKQTVVVENRPGAGAVIGTAYVAHSAPDGYTFLVGAANTITNSLLLKDLPYKDEDLVPVGMIAVAPSTIIVNPSVPASNMKEFVAWGSPGPPPATVARRNSSGRCSRKRPASPSSSSLTKAAARA